MRPTKDDLDALRGLYEKFIVRRKSRAAQSQHEVCDYFVLDLDCDKYALPALRAYADACRIEYPRLAEDLDLRVARATGAPSSEERDR